MDIDRILMSVLYGVLAIIGIGGNIWVLCLLLRQMLGKRMARSNHSMATRLSSMNRVPSTATLIIRRSSTFHRQNQPISTHMYLLLLSFTDLCCVATLPLLVVDINIHWVFGQSLCKIFYVSESLNKFMSPLILAALSFDRYLAVCRHGWRTLRQMNMIIVAVLLACAVVACALMLPIIIYSNVVQIDHDCVQISKCLLKMPWQSRTPYNVFDSTQLIFCFVLPLMVICFAYGAILMRIWHHTQHSTIDGQSVISVGRVARCSALVVMFYFVCWSPYFMAQLYNILLESYKSDADSFQPPPRDHNSTSISQNSCVPTQQPVIHADYSNAQVRARYVLHALPYTQAAFNWILYVYLNTSLRQSGRVTQHRTVSAAQFPSAASNGNVHANHIINNQAPNNHNNSNSKNNSYNNINNSNNNYNNNNNNYNNNNNTTNNNNNNNNSLERRQLTLLQTDNDSSNEGLQLKIRRPSLKYRTPPTSAQVHRSVDAADVFL